MSLYSFQPKDQIFVKGYGFLSFAEEMGKNLGKNISKNLSSNYSQEFLDHFKQSVTDAFKITSKEIIQETVEATDDLADNEIANNIIKVSGNLSNNNLETVANEAEVPKERYISPEKRQKSV